MNMPSTVIEAEAHLQHLDQRVARAARPHLPTIARRHRMAQGLRRFADRLDG